MTDSNLRRTEFRGPIQRFGAVVGSLVHLFAPSLAIAASKSTIAAHIISADVKVEQLTSNREVWRSRFGTISEREALNMRVGVLTTRYSGRESQTVQVKFFFIAQNRDRGYLGTPAIILINSPTIISQQTLAGEGADSASFYEIRESH